MHRVINFPTSYPYSIISLIPIADMPAPKSSSDHNSCHEWTTKYSGFGFGSSIFFKGPLVTLSDPYIKALTSASYVTFHSHKNYVKSILLDLQDEGDDCWPPFLLYNIQGLRRSDRINNS